jgi:hypothetical protein
MKRGRNQNIWSPSTRAQLFKAYAGFADIDGPRPRRRPRRDRGQRLDNLNIPLYVAAADTVETAHRCRGSPTSKAAHARPHRRRLSARSRLAKWGLTRMSKRITQRELESYLWGAAVVLRGLIDAGDYKQFIFPLLFYKRVSDVWDEEYQAALANSYGDLSYASSRRTTASRSLRAAHWNDVRSTEERRRRHPEGHARHRVRQPGLLDGIFGDAPGPTASACPTKRSRPDRALLDQTLSVANVPEDELGNAYEYLIKKFADDSGHTAPSSTPTAPSST